MPVHPGPQPFPLLRIPSLDAKDSDLQLHECQRGDIKARRVPARDPCGDTGVGLAVSDFAQLGDYIRGPAQTSEKIGIRFEGPQDLQTKVMITLFAKKLGRPKGSLGVSRLDGREDEIRHFLHRQDHRRHPPDALQLHRHPRAEGRCLESLHERCRYPDMEDDLKRTVCSFCGAHAQSSAPQGWIQRRTRTRGRRRRGDCHRRSLGSRRVSGL